MRRREAVVRVHKLATGKRYSPQREHTTSAEYVTPQQCVSLLSFARKLTQKRSSLLSEALVLAELL